MTAHATPGHSPGCTTWTMNVREGNADHTAIFFCSATVALQPACRNPTHPGIVDDYRKTFERVRDIKGDVFLAPHRKCTTCRASAPAWYRVPPIHS